MTDRHQFLELWDRAMDEPGYDPVPWRALDELKELHGVTPALLELAKWVRDRQKNTAVPALTTRQKRERIAELEQRRVHRVEVNAGPPDGWARALVAAMNEKAP